METPDPSASPANPVPPAAGYPQPGWPYPPRQPTNSLAIAALVVGVVSLFSCPLIGGVAVYLGNRARNEIRAGGGEGDGLAQAGVIVGWCAVGLGVLMALFMVVWFAIFGVMMASMPGRA